MELESKVVNGLERLSGVLNFLLWQKAKIYGVSPIQIQILLFVSSHRLNLCNVSYLAQEFNVTKATISDAVKVLLKKEMIEKDLSSSDKRRYNLLLTNTGCKLISDLSGYALPLHDELAKLNPEELVDIYETLTKLIYQLNRSGIIQVQRTCFKCKFYEGDRQRQHHCRFLNKGLASQEIRLDCNEFVGG